jgi:hypothetical protein
MREVGVGGSGAGEMAPEARSPYIKEGTRIHLIYYTTRREGSLYIKVSKR